MRIHRFCAFALVLALGWQGRLSAQDAPKPVTIVTDLGFVNTAGNTEITTLNLGERLTYRNIDSTWLFNQFAGAVYGRTSGQQTANQLNAGVRLDRSLGGALYLFAGAKWDKDRFAGIQRRFEEILGLSWRAIESPSDVLVLEGGTAFTQKQAITGVDDNFVSARAAADFRHSLSEKAFFRQLVELLPNLEDGDDVRLNSETALVAPLSSNIAIKMAYGIRFDNQPEIGFKKTDRVFTSGVQIVF